MLWHTFEENLTIGKREQKDNSPNISLVWNFAEVGEFNAARKFISRKIHNKRRVAQIAIRAWSQDMENIINWIVELNVNHHIGFALLTVAVMASVGSAIAILTELIFVATGIKSDKSRNPS